MTTNNVAEVHKFNVICQVCGNKVKNTEIRKRWDGLLVCRDDWEERHPLDLPHPPYRDQKALPFTHPEPTIVYGLAPDCNAKTRSAIVGYAVVGCAVVGLTIETKDYTLASGSFSTSTL